MITLSNCLPVNLFETPFTNTVTDEDVTLQRGEGEGQEKDGQDKDADQGEEQDKAGGCFL